MLDKDNIAKFCGITGASTQEARKFLKQHKRLDVAIDAFYNDTSSSSSVNIPLPKAPSTSTLQKLFDKYKDPDSDDITVDGTIELCGDLGVDPEDVVMLAIAYELKSPRIGQWTRDGWMDGWKTLRCDSIQRMKELIPRLRDQLGSDPEYYQKVYNHTFDFARGEGQRSLALETAQEFWQLLLPHGLKNGALSHIQSTTLDRDHDVNMKDSDKGWKTEYTEWWFVFLKERGGKGVSRDTWQMFLEFVRSIDSRFSNYDYLAAWPSTIDEFVEYAKKKPGN